jgi:hypothetical protein
MEAEKVQHQRSLSLLLVVKLVDYRILYQVDQCRSRVFSMDYQSKDFIFLIVCIWLAQYHLLLLEGISLLSVHEF